MAEPLTTTWLKSILATRIPEGDMQNVGWRLRLIVAFTLSSDIVPIARFTDMVKRLKDNRTNVQGARADGS